MALYDKDKIFEQAKQVATDKKLLSVTDIVDFLPLARSHFYNYFPDGSPELEELRKILDGNKIAIKTSLRAKWYNSDNATLQMALYRLAASPEEHRALNQHYIDHTSKGNEVYNKVIDLSSVMDFDKLIELKSKFESNE